jgi:V8-like Glu-specific endopeptidase
MVFLKKYPFMLSIALFFSFLDCWAMEKEDDTVSYDFGDNTVTYKGGKFKFKQEGNELLTEAHKPTASAAQSSQMYKGKPQNLSMENVLMRVVVEQDGRTQVTQTTEWPHRIHGQLTMLFGGSEYGGSGVLIGPHHVLTAGHNVYSHTEGGWPASVSVRFGLNEAVAPFGERKAVKVYTFKQWKNSQDKSYDMALLLLDHSLGHTLGWSGLLCLDDETVLKEKVTITGYPGDKGFTKMMTMSHKIKTAKAEEFYYDIDTYGGQSGSGICINHRGNLHTLGVHAYGESGLFTGNSGVRLSAKKFEKIIGWISESLILEGNPKVIDDLVSPFNLLGIQKINQVPTSQSPFTPSSPFASSIPLPLMAQGNEQIYERFLKGVLIYRPYPNSNVGRIDLPIKALGNPLEGTFDLSKCGNAGQYLSISTGYRKRKKPENASKVEIWIVPRFLIEKELTTTARHFWDIYGKWNDRASVGIFWTWGGWDDLTWHSYLTDQSIDDLPNNNLFKQESYGRKTTMFSAFPLHLFGNSHTMHAVLFSCSFRGDPPFQAPQPTNQTVCTQKNPQFVGASLFWQHWSHISQKSDKNSNKAKQTTLIIIKQAYVESFPSLNLSNNNIVAEEAKALSQSAIFTSLDLHNNNIGAEGAKALAQSTTLTSLNVSNNNIGDEGAEALSKNATLTSLDLRNNNIGEEGAKALAQNATFTSLNVSNNNIGDEGAEALSKNATLTSLDLRNNNIGDRGVDALSKNITLTSLDLRNNNIGNEGAKALAQNATLRSLDIGINDIGDDGAEALSKNITLTSLDLRNNKIGDEAAKALSLNTTLRLLALGINNISDEGAKALAQNATITSLNLYNNKIGDEGAKALSLNTTLRLLDTGINNIGAEGAKALARNATITSLSLYNNKIGDEGAKALCQNATIRLLDIGGNNLSKKAIEIIYPPVECKPKPSSEDGCVIF